MTNAAIDADRADREVDAAGQHRERLAARQDRERDCGPEGRRRAQSAVTVPGWTSSRTTTRTTSRIDSGISGLVAEQCAASAAIGDRGAGAAGAGRGGRGRACRHAPDLPHREDAAEHDDADQDRALDRGRQVRVDAEERQVGPDRGRGSATAMIGPTTPPRPPARLTPPRTIAATLCERVRPGHRRADAACSRSAPARRAPQNSPVSA